MTSENPLRESPASSTPDDWNREFILLLRFRGIDRLRIDHALAEIGPHATRGSLRSGRLRLEPSRSVPEDRAVGQDRHPAGPRAGGGVNLALGALLKWTDGVAITFGLIASIVVFVAIFYRRGGNTQ